jgi:sortase A
MQARVGLIRVVEAACWLLGAALVLVAIAVRSFGDVSGARDLQAFQDSLASAVDSPAATAPAVPVTGGELALASSRQPADVDQSAWSEQRRGAFLRSVGIDVGEPIAELNIPAVKLQVPVYEGTSDDALNRGIGRIEGTAGLDDAGNAGLAGHRDGFFRGLKDVRLGDRIVIRTRRGTRRYRIDATSIVEPSDVGVLAPTPEPRLTLVTCYPFYFVGSAPQRFIVGAVLEN